MGRSSENAGLLELPENVPCSAVPCALASAQDLFKDYPSFLPSLVEQQPPNLRSRESTDEELRPLKHVNEELKAEQSSLLLKNSELLSQMLLLRLENQRLKQQLDLQLQKKKQSAASLSISSSSLEETSSDSEDDDEVNLARVSSDEPYTTDDSF